MKIAGKIGENNSLGTPGSILVIFLEIIPEEISLRKCWKKNFFSWRNSFRNLKDFLEKSLYELFENCPEKFLGQFSEQSLWNVLALFRGRILEEFLKRSL